MTTILHGDHIVESRNRLVELKSEARASDHEILELDGGKIDIEDLVQNLETQSLFQNNRLVVIENLLGSLRAGKKRESIVAYLIDAPFDADLILWERKSVGGQLIKLKRQKHVSVEEFKLPKLIFSFVNNLKPNNTSFLLSQFRKTLDTNVATEVIFAMIVRQFRILLALAYDASIAETKRIAPWQRKQLSSQLQNFSAQQLQKLYKDLLIIDFQIKTGRSPLDLTRRIEQFIVGLT